jgi:hypothetical protein
MPFVNGYLIEHQHLQIVEIIPPESALQKGFVDVFDGLGVDMQVFGHVLDSKHFTQVVNVSSHPVCNMLTGIGKGQLLNTNAAAFVTPYLTVIDLQKNLDVCDIEVSNQPDMIFGMHRFSDASALMAKRIISHIRPNKDTCRGCVFMMNVLFKNFHSGKRKILCYTKSGHCATPFFTQVPLDKELTYRKAA